MAERSEQRTSLLVFVLPPALAIFTALYSVEHRALDEAEQREPLGQGSARIYGQLVGPEGRAAPPGIEIALVREEILSVDSPASRRCCEGCTFTLFDERCDRAPQTIAELIDEDAIDIEPNRVASTGSTGWFELDLIPAGRYAIFGAAPRGLLAFLRNVEVGPFEQREVRLESGFRSSMQGTVISDDGEPIAGAAVAAIDPRVGRTLHTESDRDGRFELHDLDPTLGYYLLARAKGNAPRGRAGVMPDEDAVVEMEDAAAITGVVTSEGKPVEGAVVSLDELNEQPLTKGDGKFRFDGLVPGYHVLRAAYRGGVGRRLELQVARGGVRNVSLAVAPVCTLRVRVEDGESEPIAGADVRLLAKESIDHRAAKTDDEGVALFEMMTLSTYEMDARRADRGKASTTLELTSGCISRNEKLVIRDSAGVRGMIVGDDNKPVSDVELSLEYLDAEDESADAVRLARTDAKGKFRVPSLAPGSWQLTALKEGYVEATHVFEMRDTRVDEDASLVLSRGGTIEGRIIDPAGGPVSSWTVHARGASEVSVRPTSRSDGGFSFSGLREGAYELQAEPMLASERDLDLGSAVTATVVAHTGERRAVLLAPGTGVLSGFVEFTGAPPPESFSVTLPGVGIRNFDGLSGRFQIPTAIAAKYPVEIRARGFSDTVVEVEVVEDRETTLEALLEAAVKLRGRVIDAADGTPIADAEVTVLSDRRTANTHKDGRFEVRGLPPGEHTVFVRATGYGLAKVGPIDVEGGSDAPDVEARLERANVRLHGRVRAGKTAMLECNALLIPRDTEDAAVYESTVPSTHGDFAIEGLPPGPYTLIVAAMMKNGPVQVERRQLTLPIAAKELDIDLLGHGGKQKLLVEVAKARSVLQLITLRAGTLDEKAIAERESEPIDSAIAVVLEAGQKSALFDRLPAGRYTVSISELHAEDSSLKALSLGELDATRAKHVELKNDGKETRVLLE